MRGEGSGSARTWIRRVGLMVTGALLATAVAVSVAVHQRQDMAPWHRLEPTGEWRSPGAGESATLPDYLVAEQALFDAVQIEMATTLQESSTLSRFDPASPTNAQTHPRNWNRTFQLDPPSPRGAALLLHGLSDSPYSVRPVAEILAKRGFWSLGLRLPGHGTVPAGLRFVSWRDWRSATELGVHAARKAVPQGPLILVGYSNGAALAVDYTLRALEDPRLPMPDRLVFLSPALAVSPLARLAIWQRRLSRLPGFRKLAWDSIVPEYDPYKYNSFAINAAVQIEALTAQLEGAIRTAAGRGPDSSFPPVLSFQSVADATIPAADSLQRIYGRLPSRASELVLFDVNRVAEIADLLVPQVDALIDRMREAGAGTTFAMTVLSNQSATSLGVTARTLSPAADGALSESRQSLDLTWPSGVYSLSHVAIPFPPSDPVYGLATGLGEPFPFGLLEPRGERGILRVPATLLTRLRYNPFFSYLEHRLIGFVDPDTQGATVTRALGTNPQEPTQPAESETPPAPR